jgi:hypothetical protein
MEGCGSTLEGTVGAQHDDSRIMMGGKNPVLLQVLRTTLCFPAAVKHTERGDCQKRLVL